MRIDKKTEDNLRERRAACYFLLHSIEPGTIIDEELFDLGNEKITQIQEDAFLLITDSQSPEEVLRTYEGMGIGEFIDEVYPE